MSEQQENYVVAEACEVAGAYEQKHLQREIDKLKGELVQKIEAMRGRQELPEEVVPHSPIHAFLMSKFGPTWNRATIADYDFGGDIHIHSAICQVDGRETMTVQAALVYQVGEVCMVLRPMPSEE